jgi:small GTP-binding protein
VVKLKIWDTAGQERFRNITQQYYKNADGILLVFDVSDRNSFDKIRDWMKQIQNNTQKENIAIVLLGNKCDVEGRQVTNEECLEAAKEFNLKYFETSALKNINIKNAFEYLTTEIINLKDNKDSALPDGNRNNNVVNIQSGNANKNKKDKGCCK